MSEKNVNNNSFTDNPKNNSDYPINTNEINKGVQSEQPKNSQEPNHQTNDVENKMPEAQNEVIDGGNMQNNFIKDNSLNNDFDKASDDKSNPNAKKSENKDDNKLSDSDMDAEKNAADEAASRAESLGKANTALTALNSVGNLNASAQEASEQDAGQNLRDVIEDTVKELPKIAIDAGTGNAPGVVVDAVDYTSKTLVKILKIIPVILLVFILIIASMFSMVGMLPSIIFGGLDEKFEERQVNKAQKVIAQAYEDRVSDVVSDIIKQTKADAEIGTFSGWKRIVAGKNEDYSVTVQRANERDALVTVKNNKTSTGLLITFENIYLTDFSEIKVDKVALANAYAYESSYSDNEKYKSGKAIDLDELFDSDETKKWRSRDTSGLKSWLKGNMESLVTYSVTEDGSTVQDGITYRQLTYKINGIFTEEQIYQQHGFSEEQKEQLRAMNFAGNMYLSACDDTSPDGTEELGFNIYPKLDVYTNLVGGNDNLIWSMLPNDYMHLIADGDEGGTASLIREYLTSVKRQVGYVADENNSTPYGKWNNTDGTNWNATMLAWCANDVDNKLNMDTKLLGDVIPNTNSVDYMTGYLFNNNYVWHYSNDNYVPQSGDVIVIYAPEQIINEDGSITVNEKPSVSEVCPELNISDANLRVTALGLVESSSGGTVTFVCGDTANHAVELLTLDMSDAKIVAYVTPNYEKVVSKDGVLNYDGEVLDKGQFLFPVKGTVTVSALYPLYPSGTPHSGLDLACPVNTPVVAANTGIVVTVDNSCKTTYGKYIKIKSETPSGTVYCIYAHLNQTCVNEGDTVSAGSVIALSGNTGNTTGPHLHFGVKNSIGVNVNPINYLARRSEVTLHATITN